ncbi:MAG: hypothetical protein D6712_05655 [Chloroflexi bacterium]|nr:MAG: hypothetical protein D6712_05655 [Chloroflexota bacterium]
MQALGALTQLRPEVRGGNNPIFALENVGQFGFASLAIRRMAMGEFGQGKLLLTVSTRFVL